MKIKIYREKVFELIKDFNSDKITATILTNEIESIKKLLNSLYNVKKDVWVSVKVAKGIKRSYLLNNGVLECDSLEGKLCREDLLLIKKSKHLTLNFN